MKLQPYILWLAGHEIPWQPWPGESHHRSIPLHIKAALIYYWRTLREKQTQAHRDRVWKDVSSQAGHAQMVAARDFLASLQPSIAATFQWSNPSTRDIFQFSRN
jgi:hypothetical protein